MRLGCLCLLSHVTKRTISIGVGTSVKSDTIMKRTQALIGVYKTSSTAKCCNNTETNTRNIHCDMENNRRQLQSSSSKLISHIKLVQLNICD